VTRFFVFCLLLLTSNINSSLAFELAGDVINIEEVLPLFNKRVGSVYVRDSQKGINSEAISVPSSVKLGGLDRGLNFNGFIDDAFFKDLIIKSSTKTLDVKIKVSGISHHGIKITPKIVTAWYQSGVSTTKRKSGGALTYELLLSDDRGLVIVDQWVKSQKGGWVYNPPDIKQDDSLNTYITPHAYKRILFKVLIGENVPAGKYIAKLSISSSAGSKNSVLEVPITINVASIKLINSQNKKYKLFLYTAFKINDDSERHGAYVNAMRLQGSSEEREELLFSYLADIKAHGFNGVTIRDWDNDHLSKTLAMTRQLSIDNVVLHATTPVNKSNNKSINPIVGEAVKNTFIKSATQLYYYGYDEPGGNKLLNRQLKLNQKIHQLDGKSVNAVFWDDMPRVIEEIGGDKSKCFDIVAYSMGSHGNRKMFAGLPYKSRNDPCSRQGTEYLVYWHPHVENPVINRIFMGFWLWASGFDGVIPHGYYFPSHIERILTDTDIKRGVSNVASPYDDWSNWLPGTLRHHNSVYPSKAGPVGTLQWEGVLSGYMDLRYVLTLEEKLEDPNIALSYKKKINNLLNEIRKDILRMNSPYMNDKDSIRYLKKLESWKKQISTLLLN